MNLHIPETLASKLRTLARRQSEQCAQLGIAAIVSPTRVAQDLLAQAVADRLACDGVILVAEPNPEPQPE